MKNLQRGFGLIGLLVILGLVIVGGGAFLYVQNKPTSPVDSNQQTATSTLSTKPNNQTEQSASIESQYNHLYFSGTSAWIETEKDSLTIVVGISKNDANVGAAVDMGDGTVRGLSVTDGVCGLESCGFQYTYKKSGTYTVKLLNDVLCGEDDRCRTTDAKVIGTVSVTVTAPQSAVTVPGMSQYTDSDFGFSFWYPSGWTVSQVPVAISQFSGGTIIKELQISGGSQQNNIKIDEINFPSGPVTTPDAGCTAKYFFDTNTLQWMQTVLGCDASPSTSVYDTKNNTMGGLPSLFTQSGISSPGYIIPLSGTSLQKAILVSPMGSYKNLVPTVNTIVSTNPSIGAPVSAAGQISTIKIEQNAYAGQ